MCVLDWFIIAVENLELPRFVWNGLHGAASTWLFKKFKKSFSFDTTLRKFEIQDFLNPEQVFYFFFPLELESLSSHNELV